ncbi:unnamed protein product [Ascophyllum nodosum]
MPKHGFLTPKAIGNRIKAKGLQKLRWYCEMCQKQCRDENGFKCHQTSEGHLRQMRIFAENPETIMQQYSEDFEKEFLDVLSRRHGTKRVRATLVYNEFIAHKTHTHMNSTQWETLTSFVLYLGKMGKVTADETEKGWYIQWVDRDPRLLAMQEAAARREKADLDDEEKQKRTIEKLVQAAKARDESRGEAGGPTGPTELRREEGQQSLRIGLKANAATFVPGGGNGLVSAGGTLVSSAGGGGGAKRPRLSGAFGEAGDSDAGESGASAAEQKGKGKGKGKKSVMEAMMEQERARKAAKAAEEKNEAREEEEEDGENKSGRAAGAGSGAAEGRKDYWLREGIVVKVMNKKVGGGNYYKKKGRLRKVVERYVGEVKMLDSGDRLRVDQEDLETVIPAIGGEVVIVNGRYRGARATLLSLDTDAFAASVRVTSDGPDQGTVINSVEYEDICKASPVGGR